MDEIRYEPRPLLIALLIIGIVFLILPFFLRWFSTFSETFGFGVYLLTIIFVNGFILTFFISAIIVYYDAERINAGQAFPKEDLFKTKTWKPYFWALLVLIIWIIVFPFYIYRRKQIFLTNNPIES